MARNRLWLNFSLMSYLNATQKTALCQHNRKERPMNIEHILHGDMPGDKIAIEQHHIEKAQRIYPLLEQMILAPKTVVCVCGGSGVGKSEIASLLAGMLCEEGMPAYVMSGDNYPRRIPMENDAHRLEVYNQGGREALADYLGSPAEIDFDLVDNILRKFKAGEQSISLKRMGRKKEELWFENVDFSNCQVLILEWTHGNSDHLTQVDIPILLNRKRNRDKGVDSPFTTMVLELEQQQLVRQAHKAKIIVAKSGNLMTYEEFCDLMGVTK